MDLNAVELSDLPREHFYITLNGKLVGNWSTLKESDNFRIHLRVLGGKGGFGSLLRSFGSQFYKSTNQDMCRDLSGRRLKDVKEEEKLKKYISKAAEREQEKHRKTEERLKKLKQLDERKHEFKDLDYQKEKERILEETEDALQQGLKALEEEESANEPGTSGTSSKVLGKRKHDSDDGSSSSSLPPALPEKTVESEPKAKKPKGGLWLGIEGLNESDLESSGDETEETEDKEEVIAVEETVVIQVKTGKKEIQA